MLNPIEKFKRSILHLNRSLHHCNYICYTLSAATPHANIRETKQTAVAQSRRPHDSIRTGN